MLAYIRKVAATKKENGEAGASAVEYGLLIAAIAAVIIGIVFGIGILVKNGFSKTSNCLSSSGTTSGC